MQNLSFDNLAHLEIAYSSLYNLFLYMERIVAKWQLKMIQKLLEMTINLWFAWECKKRNYNKYIQE